MCLGIPGQVIELLEVHEHLARVDVSGVGRVINIGLLEDEDLAPGDWVLIHVGFAMSKIDEDEAQMALEGLQMMGAAYDDELDALGDSRITAPTTPARVGADAVRRRVPRPGGGHAPSSRAHHRAGRRRPLQVHGGVRRPHPHDLPPRHRARAARARSSWCTGPGCPVCVIPMGRVDDAIAVAETPGRDLHVVRRHDARARAATATCSRPRRAAPTCASSTRRSTRCASRSRTPDREVVFFAVGFETTAPSTALTLLRARELGVTNFRVFCNHVTIVPPIKAILESPDLRLDGFLGPGHVSTVVGNRPYRFVPEQYGKPLVTAGFEPLDILQAIDMLLAQIREGRCEVENQYARVVRDEGNPRRAGGPRPRCSSCARTSSGAGSASSRRAR